MQRRSVLTGWAGAAIAVLAGCGRDGERNPATADAVRTDDQRPAALMSVYRPGQRPPGPNLTGRLLDGTPFDPAALAGKVSVVNFWASTCAPCRAETEALETVHQATHPGCDVPGRQRPR